MKSKEKKKEGKRREGEAKLGAVAGRAGSGGGRGGWRVRLEAHHPGRCDLSGCTARARSRSGAAFCAVSMHMSMRTGERALSTMRTCS